MYYSTTLDHKYSKYNTTFYITTIERPYSQILYSGFKVNCYSHKCNILDMMSV